MDFILIGILSYLFGSIPFGLLLTKFFLKKDIREIGSGNIGATNALRSGNKLIGYLTLILDITKAILPVLFVKINYPELIYLSALCAFLGHVFPIWLRFKGGKGVASYLGILFVINLSYGIIFITIWIFIFILSKYSSLSSILATSSVPIFLLISKNFSEAIFFIIMFVLIFYTHRENIKRLKNKEEKETKIY